MAESEERSEAGEGTGETPGQAGATERRVASGDPPLGDLFADLLGKLWKRGRVEVERAARKGRERLTLRQLRTDRDRMYQKLGKETRQLLEAGELDHPGLRRGVERIKELEGKLLEAEDALRAGGMDVPVDTPDDESGG